MTKKEEDPWSLGHGRTVESLQHDKYILLQIVRIQEKLSSMCLWNKYFLKLTFVYIMLKNGQTP